MVEHDKCLGCPQRLEALFEEELRHKGPPLTIIRCPHTGVQPSIFYEQLRTYRRMVHVLSTN